MTIDLIIIIVTLMIVMTAGIYASKKANTFKDYAVGNRRIPTWVITVSLIATIYGGGFLNAEFNSYYHQGLYAIMRESIAPLLMFYLTSRFISCRMKAFIGDLSIAESMGKLYGPVVRIITAILGIIVTITVVVLQFKHGLAVIVTNPIFKTASFPPIYYAIALALLTIAYSTLGGARSVVWTDLYQFFIFSICFPVIFFVLLYHIQEPVESFQGLIKNRLFCNIHHGNHLQTATFITCYSIFTFDLAQMQRFYMCHSVQQASKVFSRSILIRISMALSCLLVIVALYMGRYTIHPTENIWNYIMNIASFPGMQGLLITTIIALLMSTADSYLHTASVLFANDLWPLFLSNTQKNPPSTLKVARCFSVFIGVVTILIMVYYADSIIQFMLFYMPVVTVPIMMACFGFRPRNAAVLLTMGTNIIATAYYACVKNNIISIAEDSLLKSFVYTTLLLVLTHYLLPKQLGRGWVGIPDGSPVQLQNQEAKRWWLRKVQSFKVIFTQSYWSSVVPNKDATFIALGLYTIIYSAISLFHIQRCDIFPHIYWYITIMAIGYISHVLSCFT